MEGKKNKNKVAAPADNMDRNGPEPLFLKARCDQNIEEPFVGYSGFILLTLPELCLLAQEKTH